MNSLTALIYFAGVSENIQGVLMAMAIISGIIATGCLIAAAAFTIGEPHIWSCDENRAPEIRARWDANGVLAKTLIKKALKVCIPTAIIAAFLPSANTVYAMAAANVGKQIVESPTADKAVKALNAWLDRQISPTPEAAE